MKLEKCLRHKAAKNTFVQQTNNIANNNKATAKQPLNSNVVVVIFGSLEALDAAIGCVWMLVEAEGVRKQEIALSSLEDDFQTAIWERRVCQCYHLLDDIVAFYGKQGAVKHAALGVDLQLEVLSASSEFLSTPAAGPIETWFCFRLLFFI
ncbi:unnamed protein product [Polarella glacialis]|uniref:Uncharacterized protein n=1 Tax=Polarella glacialis TaxID=89957 RepID=A0A813HF88_POLGL|nr:unnamed protein product [Polarella glacialis]